MCKLGKSRDSLLVMKFIAIYMTIFSEEELRASDRYNFDDFYVCISVSDESKKTLTTNKYYFDLTANQSVR